VLGGDNQVSITQEIREFALDAGYSKVGITTAEDFSAYVDEVESRGNLYDFLAGRSTGPLAGANPKAIMPSAQSIIVVVWDYVQKAFPVSLAGKIGRIYQARCYEPPPHRINGARFQLLKDFVAKKGCEVNTTIELPERWAAARAGVTTYGKNTFSYADGIGSFIVIGAIVIDKELEYDNPTMECKCPPGCTACMDACPTRAIYEPFKLNPSKCIAYNAWMTREERGISSNIPHEIRDKMGLHVHGCDICQEVCPRNKKKLEAKLPKDEFLEELYGDFALTDMLHMPDGFFETRVTPIMYNYIKQRKYFQRNAAIALGNTGDQSFVPDLEVAMNNPEELVRAHAAWALGKLGDGRAKQVLESHFDRENSDKVKEEVQLALQRIEKQSEAK
jgi:epoxyqueuosine reductase